MVVSNGGEVAQSSCIAFSASKPSRAVVWCPLGAIIFLDLTLKILDSSHIFVEDEETAARSALPPLSIGPAPLRRSMMPRNICHPDSW